MIGCFIALGVIFIPIGIACLAASNSVVEVSARYDNIAACAKGLVCNVTLVAPAAMAAPVYFYYQLTNFYQNHRRYVKSRSDAQLRGDLTADTSSCDPLQTNAAMPIYPCGLIANSFFNDNFTACVTPASGSSVCTPLTGSNWQKEGIAWASDVASKFKQPTTAVPANYYTLNTQQLPLPSVTDEDFIVWMRTAGLPTFKKLHRQVLTQSFAAGDAIQLTINNAFDVSSFKGQKWVVLSTTSWLGGKNSFLGYAYIVVGAICLALALVFGVKQYMTPRKLGDMSYFRASTDKVATR